MWFNRHDRERVSVKFLEILSNRNLSCEQIAEWNLCGVAGVEGGFDGNVLQILFITFF